jgi:ATP phosphoribosyltransferase
LVKPADVPTYVDYGAADMGVVGKDTLMEEGRQLYEVLNLGFAACKMVVAGPKNLEGKLDSLNNKRVATKYPKIARDYFQHKRRESIEIIKLNGSVELAPLVGLSELIVDLVESGRTLKENDLVVLETIADISARLVVNRVSMKMESERINKIIDGIRRQVEMRGGK